MSDKYLSIITNFGCHYTCPYCIVKNNNLQIPKTTISGLDNLKTEIEKNECNWVSLSGGGDPLHNISSHLDWYKKFFDIVSPEIKIELHTSYINVPNDIAEHFERIVFHIHSFEQLQLIRRYGHAKIRVVFVVTEKFTEDLINKIAVYCCNSNNIDELSFRQMVDNHYETTHYCEEYLKTGHKKLWWYIEQNDYNIYYVENKIYQEYKTIGQ